MTKILKKNNILLGCEPKEKEAIIRKIGDIFLKDGYITKEYIKGMLEKEKVFNTNIGNEVAIPHGTESSRQYVINSGICIMCFPEGIDWGNGEKVKIVIGIAGKKDEHIAILSKIAVQLSERDDVERFLNSDVNTIYELFMEENI